MGVGLRKGWGGGEGCRKRDQDAESQSSWRHCGTQGMRYPSLTCGKGVGATVAQSLDRGRPASRKLGCRNFERARALLLACWFWGTRKLKLAPGGCAARLILGQPLPLTVGLCRLRLIRWTWPVRRAVAGAEGTHPRWVRRGRCGAPCHIVRAPAH